MSRMLKTIGSFCVVVALSALGVVGCGTDPEEACDVVCAKNEECQADSPKATCVAVCKEQVKDEAFADAIVEQSDCYEDVTCAEVTNGECVPKDL
jgi:hypothetical protein